MIKKFISVFVSFILLFSVIWFGESEIASGFSSKQITINFYNPFYFNQTGTEAKFTNYAINKFEASNPSIHINSYYCSLDDAMSGKDTEPDIGLTSPYYIKIKSDRLCNLSSIAEEEKNVIIPSTCKPLLINGKQIGIPFCAYIDYFVYNKNMIKQPPKDFDELIAMAKNNDNSGIYGLNLNLSNLYTMAPWIKEFSDFGFKDIKSGTTTLADKSMIDYFKVIEKIANENICPPQSEHTLFEDGRAEFSDEFYYDNGIDNDRFKALDTKLKGNCAMMSFPSMNKAKPIKPDFQENAFFVTQDSNYKSEAEKFIKYMTSKEVQNKLIDFNTPSVPVNENVNADSNLKIAMKQVALGEPASLNIPDNNAVKALSDAYTNAINNILDFKLTAENAAKQAYNEVLTTIRNYNREKINKDDLYEVDTTPPKIPIFENEKNNYTVKWQKDCSSYFFNEVAHNTANLQIKDLQQSSPLYPYVQKLLNEEIISLDKSHKINLGRNLSRNDFAKLLWNLYLKRKSINLKLIFLHNPFKDVKANNKFAKYILTTKNYIPYFKEKNSNYFKGNNLISREAAITAFIKILGLNTDDTLQISNYNLADEQNISKGLEPYVSAAIQYKWIDIKTCSNSKYFCPKHPVTLGEIVKLMQNVYENLNIANSKTTYGNSYSNIQANPNGACVCQAGNKIFFTDVDNNDGLYEANSDGTGIKKLLSGPIQSINSDGDWIYFIHDNTEICRINNDGTSEKIVYSVDTYKYNDPGISNMIRIKDKLYFLENLTTDDTVYDGTSLVTINLDGSNHKTLIKDWVEKYVLLNGYIYYIDESDFGFFYRMKTNGTSIEKISNKFRELKNICIKELDVIGGNLFASCVDYQNNSTNLYFIDPENYTLTKYYINSTLGYIEACGYRICYCSRDLNSKDENSYIFTTDPNINKISKLITDPILYNINIVGDWIYYEKQIPNPNYIRWASGSIEYLGELWRVKLDGSKKQKLNISNTKLDDFNDYLTSSVNKSYILQKVKN